MGFFLFESFENFVFSAIFQKSRIKFNIAISVFDMILSQDDKFYITF